MNKVYKLKAHKAANGNTLLEIEFKNKLNQVKKRTIFWEQDYEEIKDMAEGSDADKSLLIEWASIGRYERYTWIFKDEWYDMGRRIYPRNGSFQFINNANVIPYSPVNSSIRFMSQALKSIWYGKEEEVSNESGRD